MSQISSPLPITHPPFSPWRCKCFHQPLSSESFRDEKRNPFAPNPKQGNPSPLAALVICRRKPTRVPVPQPHRFETNSESPSSQNVEFLDRVENDGLTHSDEQAQAVDFVTGNDELPNKEIGSSCNFIEENGMSGAEMRREDFDFHSLADEKGAVPTREQDTPIDYVEEDETLSTKNVNLVDSSKRSGRLNVRNFVKRIISLPIAERVKVLDLLVNDDELLKISDYNDILAALVKAGEFESAFTLFSELPSRGLLPDSWSFSIMIRCSCKKNEPDEAKQILDDMVRTGFHPNVSTFTVLVNCLCKRGKLKKAFEVFEIMSEVGCKPTIRTYNCLISGLCYVGRVEEALELLHKIKKSPMSPDIYTFTLVMDGFCKVGRSDEAMELLKESMEMGLEPNIVTYNALLNGYCKEGRPLEGLRILREMEAQNCLPDLISYNIILPGLLKLGEVSAAMKIYKKMTATGFRVEERAMNTLVRRLCSKFKTNRVLLEEANKLFEKIMEMGCSPSPYTYCLMVQALAKGGEVDKALSLLDEMVGTGYSPRMLTYNVLLRVLCGEGRVDDALRVLVIMIKKDTIPSRFSFSILIDEFSRQGRLLDALGVYATAVKRGVVLQRDPRKDQIEFITYGTVT